MPWVGRVHVAWPRVIGKYDLSKINNGQWLAELCASSELTITNTIFQHMYMATIRSSKWHITDHIVVRQHHKHQVLDSRVYI